MKLKVFEGSVEQTEQKVALTTLVVRKSSTARVSTSTDDFCLFLPSGSEVFSNPFEIAIDNSTYLIEVYVQKVAGRYVHSARFILESSSRYLPSGNFFFDHDRELGKLIFLETKFPWPIKKVKALLSSRNLRRQFRKRNWL